MWQEFSGTIILQWLGFSGKLGEALHFFLYDTIKIWFLLLSIIFAVSFLRTWFNTEKVRAYLAGKREFTGNILAALFGIITPFCTCSAIPLFLGFLQARIPIGVTFSFLISAPLNNEIAIAMLFGLFGWKITAIYIGFGLFVAILGGWVIGRFNVEKYVLISVPPLSGDIEIPTYRPKFSERLNDAWGNTRDIFHKIYLWVMVGVGVGAWFHGYVPAEFIAQYAGGSAWYTVPVAVLMGIPMYSSAAGVMPLVEVLTQKGMLLGSALSFMMAVTALSLPEAIILKQILHIRLIALFFAIITAGIMGIGFIFNTIL
ncbi:MAG: permease [Sulfuricurvum sp.]|uniref:permease n=1 Tax=Sulfuricurvum sp. TaxID=2025608 RepID=UPI0026268B19|nr:permease [Sulfuricurvum sp.]MDD2951168.1 permease [Sulfuricurvum sp.]MDD5118008.1 permease [Sulfuricurvum sp.]